MVFSNIYKGGILVKRLAGIFAAVALLATGAASLGSMWWIFDEPKAHNLFED